ncbi:MAG: trehalose-6-phosphate synthase [Anaerolineaceae bacterium]|nr:trehalose-6-phosphate synthase [Anaerolineaceae bacterium]
MDSENDTCQELQSGYLADRALIIAANRAPVVFEKDEDGTLQFERGGGGLVTALTGLCRQAAGATWFACARTDADAEWRHGTVTMDEAQVRIEFLSPEPEAYEGYYNVIANPLLWFVQHSMWDVPRAPVIDRHTWEAWQEGYEVVNRIFARAITEQVRRAGRPTLVMLQDYHLYLVAREIRSALPRGQRPAILHFVHIPWPGAEYWRILPATMRQAILDSLCAVDVLGFQTGEDGLNFLRTCESLLPQATVNYRRRRVWYRNHATHVRAFPISIDVEALRERAQSEEVAAFRADVEEIVTGCQAIVRIDRLEPSKNIVRGFLALGEMLERHPEHQGHVQFLALLVPSRMDLKEYQDYLSEVMATAGQVNAHYGTSDWEPVRVLVGDSYTRALAAMQCYDVLLVNSIVDGMNLVAKEGPILNERDGVLILSERTGAREQLESGALIVAPCDVFATAEAMHQALTMPLETRQEWASRLRWTIERQDIAAWLCAQLQALVKLGL